MTDVPSILAELLTECDTRGIRLKLAGDDGLTIDATKDSLTPGLLERLKAQKGELLAILRPAPEVALAPPVATIDAPAKPTKAVCRCGSTAWRDVPIHDGQSIRRDCGQCGRFLDFPIWYVNNAGQKGQ